MVLLLLTLLAQTTDPRPAPEPWRKAYTANAQAYSRARAVVDPRLLPRENIFTVEVREALLRAIAALAEGPAAAEIADALAEALDEHRPAPGVPREPRIGEALAAPRVPEELRAHLPPLAPPLSLRFVGDALVITDLTDNTVVDMFAGVLSPLTRRGAAQDGKAGRAAADLSLPNDPDSVKFLVIGDPGTGEALQYALLDAALRYRQRHPYRFVLVPGDLLYTDPDTKDALQREFVSPFEKLRGAGILVRPALGNHDNYEFQTQQSELGFEGRRFYAFTEGQVRFLALDSDYFYEYESDPEQLAWLDKTLAEKGPRWTVAFFHHPLFSSGKHHGQNSRIRAVLLPKLKGKVDVAIAGHEHFYERVTPQEGVAFFVSGAGAKLRKGDLNKPTGWTARGHDKDRHFLAAEVTGDDFYYLALTDREQAVDCGVVTRAGATPSAQASRFEARCRQEFPEK